MTERREFIRNMAIGTVGMLAGCTEKPVEALDQLHGMPSNASTDSDGPIVLSTWNHGIAANAKAWEVMKSAGTVLDAVEQGVMVTESDFTNRSVGLGGTPDREGHTTLDLSLIHI